MAFLDLSVLTDDQRPTGAWAAALLLAIARDEAAGRRPPRVTEPKLETWSRFRGRLTNTDLLGLLFEDAAVIHPVPFDSTAVGGPDDLAEHLPSAVTNAWLASIAAMPLTEPGSEYVLAQARTLGVPTRMARSELHAVKPHQKVLELPGTGGQLAHHLVSTQQDLTLQDNFTIACSSWQEMTLAGLIALELGAPRSDFVMRAELEDLRATEHVLRHRAFDFVIGLHPDKGGLFRIEDQLAIWFSTARVLLV